MKRRRRLKHRFGRIFIHLSLFFFFFTKTKQNFIYNWKLKQKILGSESVTLPRSLDQKGLQQAGKQTQGPIRIILLKSVTQSKEGPQWQRGEGLISLALDYISPHCEITTGSLGLLLGPVGTFSIFRITRSPSMIFPNTTCFPSSQSHLEQVMKNWQPFVLGPLFAMESRPGAECLSLKFSSANGPR